jgi:hypothetical protein
LPGTQHDHDKQGLVGLDVNPVDGNIVNNALEVDVNGHSFGGPDSNLDFLKGGNKWSY